MIPLHFLSNLHRQNVIFFLNNFFLYRIIFCDSTERDHSGEGTGKDRWILLSCFGGTKYDMTVN